MPISQAFKSHGGDRLLKGDFELPPNIDAAFHAMAIHERRPGFDITRIRNAYEVWFPGVHGEIGSGAASLQWMASKAKRLSVPVDAENTLAEFDPSVAEAIKERGSLRRNIRLGDRIHKCAKALSLSIELNSLVIEDN